MLSMATILSIAAAWWGVSTPTWQWESPAGECRGAPACAYVGSGHVTFNRAQWDAAARWQKCMYAIHETGHASVGLYHTRGTVMSDDYNDEVAHLPVLCYQPPFYNQRLYPPPKHK